MSNGILDVTPEVTKPQPKNWVEAISPMIQRLRVAGALNKMVTIEPEGCTDTANILQGMADRLDLLEKVIKHLKEERENQTQPLN